MTQRYSLTDKKVFVAGHRGMVGQALVRALEKEQCTIQTVSRADLDLKNQTAVQDWFSDHTPDIVFLAAAKVGGIMANSLYPAEFLFDNVQIQQNVLGAARQIKTPRLVFLGSSCIYPRLAPQPISEESLLTGPLEETNQWYAIAKIAGLKLVEAFHHQYGLDYFSVMPTNLYGPGDTYDVQNSHVIPALLLKFHEAKITGSPKVTLWGTGTVFREFMHVDDLANACLFLSKTYHGPEPINIGVGKDLSIKDLALLVSKVVGYEGQICFDPSKPDGTPQKLLNITKLTNLGWTAKIALEEGLKSTYVNFRERINS